MARLFSDSSVEGRISHALTHEDDGAGLGELLRRARERRGLTLEQIASETKIPQRHLEALEHENLAAVPGGFYRRAEIRAFARAVNLDQNVALARLVERAKDSPVASEVRPERPRTHEPAPSRKRLLMVISVVVAAAVFGRGAWRRAPALDGDAQEHGATDLPQHRAPPVQETPSGAVIGTSPRAQLNRIAPSVPTEGALAVATEPTGVGPSAVSKDEVGTIEKAEARAFAESVTELVVTTQPSGARVTVNGIGWGITPVTIRYLPAGDKRIRVSKEGYATEERVVPVAEGHSRMLDIQLRSAP
jgi:cytoskeletal protein RodZ